MSAVNHASVGGVCVVGSDVLQPLRPLVGIALSCGQNTSVDGRDSKESNKTGNDVINVLTDARRQTGWAYEN